MRYDSYSPIERGLIGPQLLQTAEKKASELRSKYSPNLSVFMDEQVYGKAAVMADLQKVLAKERQFTQETAKEKEAKRIADVFEIFYVDAATQMQWFGANATIESTARFDDYFNGVDVMTSFAAENSRFDHLALSTDLTFGYDASLNKVESVMSDISAGKMAQVRYFQSPDGSYAGRLSNIPKTIIGLDAEHLPDFIRLWTHDPTNKQIIDFRNILVSQQYHQLRAFTAYADKIHGESPIRSSYSRAATQMATIYKNLQLSSASIPDDAITRHVTGL